MDVTFYGIRNKTHRPPAVHLLKFDRKYAAERAPCSLEIDLLLERRMEPKLERNAEPEWERQMEPKPERKMEPKLERT